MESNLQLILMSKATACPTRVYLLGVLGPEGCTVTEAAATAGISVGTASYHLRRLLGAGLARMSRRGRSHVYKWGKDRWVLVCQQTEDDTATGETDLKAE
jgi:DNA-binding transcriptional ArsR family regulator